MKKSRLAHAMIGLACIGLLGSVAAAQDVCEGVSPVDNTDLTSVIVVSGLTQPLYVDAPPGDVDRIFILEQPGRIRVHKRGDAPTASTVFLDLTSKVNNSGNERGLLGLAFDANYATNRKFYVNYTTGVDGDTIVSQFNADPGNPDVALGASERVLMLIDQPESNHNGGQLLIGPDDMLYIFTGDGGGGGDAHGACGNGQNTGTLLGKILRIDPNLGGTITPDCGSGLYRIPPGNPFTDGSGGVCDEIWAYGMRNPWRNAFDAANGDLYTADVGQGCWEEVNWVPGSSTGGENYGWRQMEGTHCYNPSQGCNATSAAGCTPACNSPTLTDPVLDYSRSGGPCSVTGGFVYRGCRMRENFDGKYFYGDYCAGFVRSMVMSGGAATNIQDWASQLGVGGFDLTSFGIDAQGEHYITDRDGEVRKIVPPFPDMEVSALGVVDADQFLLDPTGDWTWENLSYNSMHPLDYYQVYKGTPNGVFTCIHSTGSTSWPLGGDPVDPIPGELFAYVVTGVNPSGQESSSGDPARNITSPCGPPGP